jgi:hypothetical protein
MVNKHITTILFILILFMGGGLWYMYNEYSDMKVKLATEIQNRVALGDSLRITKNLTGELVYSKAILIADNTKLKSFNKELSNKLETMDGKIMELTSTIFSLEMELDTIGDNQLVQKNDSTYGIEWRLEKMYGNGNTRILSGVTNFNIQHNPFEIKPINTILTRDYLNISVLSGLRRQGGIIESFSTSQFPGFSVNSLESAIISGNNHPIQKKKKRWINWGINLGYGLTHNPFTNETMSGFQIGGGLNIRPF